MDATESGRNPVEVLAEEFIERQRRGEKPTLEEYAGKFPQLAEPIRELFPALVMMEKLGAESDFFAESGSGLRMTLPRARLEQIGDFRILSEIGRGGMGVVYEAEQESLGRRVALKVLSGRFPCDTGHVQRFEREARSAARLHHTNIVPVFGVGQQDGMHYYVMQFIQGQGLDEVLRELKRLRKVTHDHAPAAAARRFAGPERSSVTLSVAESLLSGEFRVGASDNADPPSGKRACTCDDAPSDVMPVNGHDGSSDSSIILPGESELSTVVTSEVQYARSIARIGIQVAGALDYANTQGIFHRDIKPSNLLLDIKGTVWVTDFGLAKSTETSDLTHTGDIVGTLRYMAPERFSGRCDARSDVYSLGLTLYELLALRPAYDEHDRQRLIQRVTQEQPLRLEKLNSAVPRDLATVIHKAIEPEPDHRYATAGDLANDLQRFLDDKPTEARHIRPHERLWRWRRRNPALAALTAVVLLLLVAIAVTSSVSTVRLQNALADTQAAQADTNDKLWSAYLAQARAGRLSRQPGRRFDGLRAVGEALKLPLPKGRSLDDLRTEAIAALCVPDDLEVARQWNGCPTGTNAWAIDDDFERYARGDGQGNVSVRRIADDQELFHLPGEGVSVWEYDGLQFSPDGRWLHVLCSDTHGWRACLWRLEETQPVAVLNNDGHFGLVFRPDSQMFAAAYPDRSLRLFDAQTGREVRRFDDVVPQVDALLRWNPRFPQIAVMRPRAGCRVLNLESGDKQPELAVACEWIDWHPDGRLLAASGCDFRIYLYDAATGQPVSPPLEGHKDHGIIVRFNHAGDRLASNDWSGMLRLWDTRTGRQALAQPARGACLAFSRDDRMLAADLNPPGIRLFRCHTSHEFCTVRRRSVAAEAYRSLTVRAGDGRLLAVQVADDVALVDSWRGEEVATLSHPKVGQHPFYFEPHDASLWTSGPSGVVRWPLRADGVGDHLHVGPPQTLFPSDYASVAAGSVEGDIVCIPLFDSGALLWRRKADERITLRPQDDVRFVAVSPDGGCVATGTHQLKAGAGAKVWNGRNGEWLADLPVAGFCQVGFSPDGRWLVTTGGGARIWEVGTWQEGPKLAGMPASASFCFADDSRLLALSGSLSEVRLLRTETGEELARLTAPEQTRLSPQAFARDGTQLVVFGHETAALYVFDLRAIRSQLVEFELDWEAPPFPPSPAGEVEPIEVEVDLTPASGTR